MCLCFHFGFSLLFLVLICFICVISVCLTFAVFGLAGVILRLLICRWRFACCGLCWNCGCCLPVVVLVFVAGLLYLVWWVSGFLLLVVSGFVIWFSVGVDCLAC